MRLSTKLCITVILVLATGLFTGSRVQAQTCEITDCTPQIVVAADTMDQVYETSATVCSAWIPASANELAEGEDYAGSFLDPISDILLFGSVFDAYMEYHPSAVSEEWAATVEQASTGEILWSDAAWTIFEEAFVDVASARKTGDTLEVLGETVTKESALDSVLIGPMLSEIAEGLESGSADWLAYAERIQQWPYSTLPHCVHNADGGAKCYPSITDFLRGYPAAYFYLDAVEPVQCNLAAGVQPVGGEIVSSPSSPVVLLPGEETQLNWRLRNTGDEQWGQDTQLVHVSGGFVANPSAVDAPATAPGMEANFVVMIVAPQAPGAYTGRWQLKHLEGEFFGPVLTLELLVAEPDSGARSDGPKREGGVRPAEAKDATGIAPTCDELSTAGVVLYDEQDCGGEQLEYSSTGDYALAYEGFDDRATSVLVGQDWSVLVSDDPDGEGVSLCISANLSSLENSTYPGTSLSVDNSISHVKVFDRPNCEEPPLSGCAAVVYGGVILYDDVDCGEQGLLVGAEGAYPLKDFVFQNKASSIFVSPGWSVLIAQDEIDSGATLCISETLTDLSNVVFLDTQISANDSASHIAVFPNAHCQQYTPILTTPSDYMLRVNYPRLVWAMNTSMAVYEIEIDDNADFSSLTQNDILAHAKYTVSGLEDGLYYWRVRGQNRDESWSDWSASRSFIVDTIAPEVPIPLSPGDGDFVSDATLTLSWTPEYAASLYHVQADNDTDFSSPEMERISGFSSPEMRRISGAVEYTASQLDNGAYIWRVRARDLAGNWSDWSESRRVFVEGAGGDGIVASEIYSSIELPVTNIGSNLRSGPGTEYEIVGQAVLGAELVIIGIDPSGDWCRLLGDAWISCSLVDNVPDSLPVLESSLLP